MKQAVSIFVLAAICMLFCSSLFLIFLHVPQQKADFYENQASRSIFMAQNTFAPMQQRQQAAKDAKVSILNAIRHNPYNGSLWVRLANLQNISGENSDNDTMNDAARIAGLLRPDLRLNFGNSKIEILEDDANEEEGGADEP